MIGDFTPQDAMRLDRLKTARGRDRVRPGVTISERALAALERRRRSYDAQIGLLEARRS